MISKEIKYDDLYKAIKIALVEDKNIVELYDPNIRVENANDVVDDIYRKIFEIKEHCICKGVFEKEKLIGYYVYTDLLLLSFSISSQYRTRGFLRDFFSLIRRDLGKKFMCRLWSKNIRAIKWLLKNNFEIVESKNEITELVYLKK